MRFGQASLEFILVAVFLMGLITILLPTASNLVDQISSLDDVAVTKSSLNSIASAISYVRVSGNGSAMHVDAYIPKNVNCFVGGLNCTLRVCKEWITESQNTKCSQMETFRIRPISLYPGALNIIDCQGKTGWLSIVVSNENGDVKIDC